MSDNGNNGQGKAIVKGPAARQANLKTLFEQAKPGIAAVLPKHLTADKLLKIVLSATSRTPELLDCTPQSVLLAVMQAAALGLEPCTPLQLGYLIPYKNAGKSEAQFIPGYRGLIRLANNSGEINKISARVVHEKDTCEIVYGTEEKLVHIPYINGDPGALVAAYAIATMKSGERLFEFLPRHEIERIRDRSKAATNGPWVTDFDEMAKKTAIRRLAKTLPLSEEKLARALEHQAAAEAGSGPDFSDVIDVLPEHDENGATEPTTRTDEMKERLAAKAAS
jgi:recombination protein RecT